jgi:hypothetical protein
LYIYNTTHDINNFTEEMTMGGRIDRLSQRTRRILAVAALAGLPTMFAWSTYWQTTTVPGSVWGPVSFVLIGATVIGAAVLYWFVRHRAEIPGHGLDERQRQLRDRAWIMSYQVLSVVVVVGLSLIGVLVLGLGHELTVDPPLANALVLCTGTLIPLLPVAALAWVEPDVPAGD